MVSIAAFQAVDPGSIPGRRMFCQNHNFHVRSLRKKNFVHAVTRIRTWVTAATTQGPNHQTITAKDGCSNTGSIQPCTLRATSFVLKVIFITNVKQFSWCSGYHICLTHRRSPVRSRAKTCLPTWSNGQDIWLSPRRPGFNSRRGKAMFFSMFDRDFLVVKKRCRLLLHTSKAV